MKTTANNRDNGHRKKKQTSRKQVARLVDEQLQQDIISGVNKQKPPSDSIIQAMRCKTPYPKGKPAPTPITQSSEDENGDVDTTQAETRQWKKKQAER